MAGDDDDCEDSDSWYKAGKPSKDCDWIADDPEDRCGDEGEDGSTGYEGCPDACGLCPDTDDRSV